MDTHVYMHILCTCMDYMLCMYVSLSLYTYTYIYIYYMFIYIYIYIYIYTYCQGLTGQRARRKAEVRDGPRAGGHVVALGCVINK